MTPLNNKFHTYNSFKLWTPLNNAPFKQVYQNDEDYERFDPCQTYLDYLEYPDNIER